MMSILFADLCGLAAAGLTIYLYRYEHKKNMIELAMIEEEEAFLRTQRDKEEKLAEYRQVSIISSKCIEKIS